MAQITPYIPAARGVLPFNLNLGNSVVVGPNDDLPTKYDWLKSSDRDTEMGALSNNNRRTLILTPGQHIITDTFALDTEYVDITSTSQNPSDTVILMESMSGTLPSATSSTLTPSQAASPETRDFTFAVQLTGAAGIFAGWTTDMCGICEVSITDHNYSSLKIPVMEVAVDESYIIVDIQYWGAGVQPSDLSITPYYRSAVEQRANHIELSGFTINCQDTDVLSAFGIYTNDYRLGTFVNDGAATNHSYIIGSGGSEIGEGVNAIGTTASIFGVGVKQCEVFESFYNAESNEGWHTIHFTIADKTRVYLFDTDTAISGTGARNCFYGWADNKYINMSFVSLDDGTGGGFSSATNISVFGYSHIHGTWTNCIATGAGWSINDSKHLRADMFNCRGGNKAFGNDYLTANISGNLTNCTGEEQAFGGCGVWGVDISGTLINCNASSDSFGKGRIIEEAARLINCYSGTNSFAGGGAPYHPYSGLITLSGHSVTRAGDTLFTASLWSDDFAGFAGQEVYILGNGIIDGYYKIANRFREVLQFVIIGDVTDGAFVDGEVRTVFSAFRGYAKDCHCLGEREGGYAFGSGPTPAQRTGTLIGCSSGDINSAISVIEDTWRNVS
jgi:hypothetical protein